MNLKDIISKSEKPAIYEKGNAFMWTDEHISKQILNIHLNPDIDLASRKKLTIQKTANWILSLQSKRRLKILDLGCGPGLYTEIFASAGHEVTGVDISKKSIEYAQKSAIDRGLDIKYINADYLDFELYAGSFDLIVMIYTDFGVLIPKEREALLQKVYGALKPNGQFIFDTLKDSDLEQKITPKIWEASKNGFWSPDPYLALSESYLYQPQKVILYQHLIIDELGDHKIYRFWTHFFNAYDLSKMLKNNVFAKVEHRDDVLPTGDKWNGNNVIFTMAIK